LQSHLELRVSDTGQGIHPDLLPHVFDRLRQGDSTSTRAHGGLGIGLALVRHLVELHGGAARAESPGEGKGATFTVTLPLTAVEIRGPTHPRGPLNAASLKGVRVLVVDDDPSAVELVVETLTQSGAEARGAGSVADALPLLAVVAASRAHLGHRDAGPGRLCAHPGGPGPLRPRREGVRRRWR
jgi:hypothetical protein